jgi:hypothetical protein
MSKWEDLRLDSIIREILSEVEYAKPDHHLGRPFLTAYQLAIEIAYRHPAVASAIGFPVGGKGTDEHNSLAQYLAGQLSRRIREEKLLDIEGGFLSNRHLRTIAFDHAGVVVESSMTGGSYDLSMFRLKQP